jgi:hypothetical protein
MRITAWAIAGSLLINLVLGLLVAAAFSIGPPAQAAEATHCAGQHAVHPPRTPAQPAPSGGTARPSYVVAARMGWAVG